MKTQYIEVQFYLRSEKHIDVMVRANSLPQAFRKAVRRLTRRQRAAYIFEKFVTFSKDFVPFGA